MELGSMGLCKVYRSRSSKTASQGKGRCAQIFKEVPLRTGKKGRISFPWEISLDERRSQGGTILLEDTTGKRGKVRSPPGRYHCRRERSQVVQSP